MSEKADDGLNKLWYLKRINLFTGLTEDEIKYIDSKSCMRTFKKGELIYIPQSNLQQIYFLKKGKVKLYKTDLTGKEMVFAILKDKECFGSLSPLEKGTANEFAEAMEESLTCFIDKNVFFSFIQDKPSIVLRLNKVLSLKMYELEVLLEELTFKTVQERMVSLFLKLDDKFGVPFNRGKLINIKLTHNDIASMIGSTRESTTVALNTLKKQGLIDSRKKKFILVDHRKLKEYSAH